MCYTLPDGTRKQRSSGTPDYHEALRLALRLEQASMMAAAGKLTKAKAAAIVDEIYAVNAQDRIMDQMTTRVFFEQWLASWKRSVAPASARKGDSAARGLLESLGPLADSPMALVDPASMARWRDTLRNEGLAAKTVADQIRFVRSVFAEAQRQGRIDENPAENLKPPRIVKGERARKRPFTWPQFQNLVAQAPSSEWRLLILLGGFTGQRLRDCQTLRWNQVDFARSAINFQRGKNRDVFDVPLHPELLQALEAIEDRRGALLPGMSRWKATGDNSASSIFTREILPLIGITQTPEKLEGRGRNVLPYSFHSLRHTLSTALNEAGVSEFDRMRIIGHESREVSRGYTHAELAHAAAQLSKVPGLG